MCVFVCVVCDMIYNVGRIQRDGEKWAIGNMTWTLLDCSSGVHYAVLVFIECFHLCSMLHNILDMCCPLKIWQNVEWNATLSASLSCMIHANELCTFTDGILWHTSALLMMLQPRPYVIVYTIRIHTLKGITHANARHKIFLDWTYYLMDLKYMCITSGIHY